MGCNHLQHDCYQSNLCGDIPYNDYDLAILELASDVDLSSYVANTACLPYGYGLDDFVGENCFATGFGDTKGIIWSIQLQMFITVYHTIKSIEVRIRLYELQTL